ncbi:transmembrane protein [Cystoisospora suis]|uniref:Transmembrane protein n=1 Tax=Cystoisospora suis TaxID=483139 RepID=A0A2C6LCV6_9APIC|nr:transmembrane protein [Cystoisospora suis]
MAATGTQTHTSPPEKAARTGVSWFLVSLLVLQIGLLGALYVHNMQLATSGAEKAVRVQMLEEKLEELSAQQRQASACPPCDSLHEKMEKGLRTVHDDFEKTADKLSSTVNNLQTKINQYGSKFDALMKKVQNNPLLKQFGGF